jgi:rhodanese-related sulfurtransferase
MKKIIFIIFAFILCSQFLTAQINVQSSSKDGYLEIGKAKIYYEEKGIDTPKVEINKEYSDSSEFNITTEQAEKMIAENTGKSDFMILDVRTPEEVASGYISGSVNIDIKAPDFQEKINALSKDKTYIVYCKRGGRSSKAFDMMKEKGFAKVYNMLGGIMKWKEESRKIEIK